MYNKSILSINEKYNLQLVGLSIAQEISLCGHAPIRQGPRYHLILTGRPTASTSPMITTWSLVLEPLELINVQQNGLAVGEADKPLGPQIAQHPDHRFGRGADQVRQVFAR